MMISQRIFTTKVHIILRIRYSAANQLRRLTQTIRLSQRNTSTLPFQSYRYLFTQSADQDKKPILTMFTKNNCQLCDESVDKLAPFLDQVQFELVDIKAPENQQWNRQYQYDIPVFHLNGKFLMKHRANLELLHERLSELKVCDS